MPQPLSRVKPDAHIFLTAKLIHDQHPALVAKVGHAIALSAHIENLLAGLLITMLSAQARPAAAMLRSLNSLGVKAQAIAAAAEEALDEDDLDLFTAVVDLCEAASKHRHRFVHWSWAHSDDVPNAILFIDPKALLGHEAEAKGFVYPNEGRGLYDEIDKRGVLVYSEPDLTRAVDELERAHDKLGALRMCLIPNPHARKAFADMRQRLSNAPDVAPKLERLRAQRKSAREE